MADQGPQRPPNFLIIMSDEHAPMFSSTYGHPLVRTPNMDRLATEGVTFDNAYANSPLCVPARASFMTGRIPSKIRAWDNTIPLASDLLTWPYLLRSRGYNPVLTGKMHLRGPDPLHGFTEQLTYCISSVRESTREVERWRDGFKPAETPFAGAAKAGPADGEAFTYDSEVEESAVSYLRGRASSEEPFALCVGFYSPHPPFQAPDRYFNAYYPDNVDMPIMPEGHLTGLPSAAKRLQQFFGYPDEVPEEHVKRARAAYYGMITALDERIGRLVQVLREEGLDENTIVIYTSDHGDMMGEHGLWQKGSFYEQSSRIPLQIVWPGHLPAGHRVTQVVSLVDLMATIADLADVPRDEWKSDGDTLVPLMSGDGSDWKDEAFAEYFAHGTDRPQAMVRQGQWKLCYGHGSPPEVELYDLDADPGEFNNLAGKPEYQETQERLMQRILQRWGDPDELTERISSEQDERALIRRVSGLNRTF